MTGGIHYSRYIPRERQEDLTVLFPVVLGFVLLIYRLSTSLYYMTFFNFVKSFISRIEILNTSLLTLIQSVDRSRRLF
jgi:hypothetical protein